MAKYSEIETAQELPLSMEQPESPTNLESAAAYSDFQTQLNRYSLDFSYLNLDGVTLQSNLERNDEDFDIISERLYLQHNRLDFIPHNICRFPHLQHLDISNNHLTEISNAILTLHSLKSFVARNNFLGDYSLPKKLGASLVQLEELNLSGNRIRSFPPEILDLVGLKSLYLGGNEIEDVPIDIWKLEKLEVLYLGGNNLKEIPAEMGRLHYLRSLVLCENQLQSLPSTISCLRRLQCLSLHKNMLTTLPPEIVTLKGLVELSLRDNPLVVRFVQELTYDPPTLRELAARCIKIFRVPYDEKEIPVSLSQYLQSACRCVNPRCRGVYFDVRVEHIKFVDFCGKYRIPLLQYLCSPHCSIQPVIRTSTSDSNSSDDDSDVPKSRLKRVLLG